MRTIHLNKNDGGLIQGTTGENLPGNFTPDAKNVDLDTRGLIVFPRRGYRPFLDAPLALDTPITGMWMHRRKDGTGALIVACGDTIYHILANRTVENLGDGLNGPDFRWHGVTFKGKLFLSNGHNPPKVYNTVLENLAGIEDANLPTSWTAMNYPSHFNIISLGGNQHLVAWGLKRDPSRFYASDENTYLQWDSEISNAFSFAPLEDNGEPLRAVFSYKDYVVCLKRKTGVVYYGIDPSNLAVADAKKIPFGVSGMESVIYHEDDVWWISQDGPISLESVLAQVGIAAKYSTHRIPDVVGSLSPVFLAPPIGIHDQTFKRLRWFAASRRSVENSLLIDHYYARRVKDHDGVVQGAWMWGEGPPVNCALVYQTAGPHVVLFGGYDGMIYQMNYTYQDNGTDIESYYSWPVIEPGVKIRVPEIDFKTVRGGDNLRARLYYDDGNEAHMPSDLTPNVERKTVRRVVPFGYGYDTQLKVEHKGGAVAGELRGVRMRVDPARVR